MKKLGNELFLNLVNYLDKPDGIKYSIIPEAYMLINDSDLFPQEYIGKQIMLFFNRENEVLCGVTPDNKVVQIEYGINAQPVINSRKTFRNPDFEMPCVSKPKKIPVKLLAKKKTNSNQASIEKRFHIISLILFLLFILSIFAIKYKENFYSYTMLLYFGTGLWFLWDYKMLQSVKMYLKCLYLAIGIFAFGLSISTISNELYSLKEIYTICFLLPILFLLIQRPVRLMFIYFTGNEPVVEENAGFSNTLYTIGIIVLPIVIGFIVEKLLRTFI